MDRDRSGALATLGYPPRWIEYDLLPADLVAAQLQVYRVGDDQNSEHFRYAAFQRLLDLREFSDARVAQYLDLVGLDPDAAMAAAALRDLLARPELSDAQFELVTRHPYLGPESRAVRRQALLRDLRRDGPSGEVVARFLTEADGMIQGRLLQLPALPRAVVAALAERGATRGVRNAAQALLRQRQYREK